MIVFLDPGSGHHIWEGCQEKNDANQLIVLEWV